MSNTPEAHNRETTIGNSKITVGRFTYGYDHLNIRQNGEGASLRIGSFCSIASNILIMLGLNHYHEWATTFPFGHMFTNPDDLGAHDIPGSHSKGDINIGHDVWIGNNVTIMSGITIGNGAVLAANAHVVKSVEPYSIVGGNPAKHIKYRFEPEIIALMHELKWWDLNLEQIREIAPELCKPPTVESIQALIERVRPSIPQLS